MGRLTFISVFLFALLSCCSSRLWAQKLVTKVACLGNSVTYGYGLKDAEHEAYPAVLQQLLGERYQMKNFGHSGATLLKKGHNPYYKTKAFAEAIAFKPDIAVIHLGLNDTDPRNWPNYNDEFESDYAWLLDTLKKVNPSIQLYICKLTPIFSAHARFKSGTRDWYDQIQQKILQIASANKIRQIDLNEALFNRPDLFADNLHPDKEGASIIAKTVYQNISKNFGGLKLANVFSNNMVLQRNRPIPVYGSANAGDKVAVTFNKQKRFAVATEAGKWRVDFPAFAHGGPYDLRVDCNGKSIELSNILIGDVWLCSGQSNMDFQLKNSETGTAELAHAANSLMRLYKLNGLAQTDNEAWDAATLLKTNKLEFFSGSWQECIATTAANFSAVAYYFGKKIALEEGVPVGLIQVAVGGAPTESFIDRYTLEHDNLLVDMMNNWRNSDFTMQWCRERAEVNLKNATKAKQRHPFEPCYNYEAGIAPLTQFPIKGVAWYQGESNAHNIELHEHLFKTLVQSWRKSWGYNFPFYYAQLSSIDRPSWPQFRNSQRLLLKQIPNIGMVVTSDLGDSLNVHPIKKEQVGERLALQALRYTYKKPVTADGPSVLGVKREGASIIISFSGSKKLFTSNNQPLIGFELVNKRGMRLKADASIVKSNVVIPVPTGEEIKTVLYGWQPFTRANLVNEAGLPASTFSITLKQ
jgi:sialate O-acetylesterase